MKDGAWRSLFETLAKQGWIIETTKGGHIKLKPPTGMVVIVASTPSDRRALANTRSLCRRSGATL